LIPEYPTILRCDFMSFIERSFYEVNPQTRMLWAPHIELIAAKLDACRLGKVRRLIINVPPRQLKSLCASVAFPPGVLGTIPLPKSSAPATARTWPTNSPETAAG
jgi:hypothetical protein